MNKNEKKAIKSLKEFAYNKYGTFSIEEAKTILNLIEKQEKTIEEKDKRIKKLNVESQKYFDNFIDIKNIRKENKK